MNFLLRHFTLFFVFTTMLSCASSCASKEKLRADKDKNGIGESTDKSMLGESTDKVVLTEAQWQAKLTPVEYNILREKGTEPAFSGEYNAYKEDGLYVCAGCGNPLFDSAQKFDSGTGWPSYSAPVSESRVSKVADLSHGMTRTEVTCNRCDGHLGHLFDDGPAPTGERWCINSVSLRFRARDSLDDDDDHHSK